jgi:hypothetical protein
MASSFRLEFFLSGDPVRVGKVAVKREKHVLHFGIHRVVKTFYRVGTRRNLIKSVIELGEIVEIEGDMPFREMRWPETELTPSDAETGDETATFQMLKVPTDGGDELNVAYIVLQGAPDVINVHRVSAPGASVSETFRPKATKRRQRERVG